MPGKEQRFKQANTEELVAVNGMRTGRKYLVRRYTYGVLVPDEDHPLSTVSVSNSSLSVDLWTGCLWQCRYCHVQGTLQDIGSDGRMPTTPRPRTRFSVGEVVDELVRHPFFVKDQTVISIGTASTEPFASGAVCDSTFEIMRTFVARGLRNPFWIVTKAGIPKGKKQELAVITSAVKGLMISICWADNPDTIEPVRSNRFRHCEEAKEAGATLSWYMRPIVPEWSGTPERIEMMMLWVSEHYRGLIDMIVPGGLRWTEGIEYGLSEVHGLPMPDIPHDDNVKALPENLRELIVMLGGRLFPGVPIYHRSSCALTHMLHIPSLTSVCLNSPEDCENSVCPATQRQVCARSKAKDVSIHDAQRLLNRLGVPARAIGFDPSHKLVTDPPLTQFTYAVGKSIENQLALKRMET